MLVMENSEEVLQVLERYSKMKPKDIPKELEDYLCYVARTGDTLYRWFHVKHLFREKLLRVIKEFHENTPGVDDLPQYPNVDPFNYESMKSAILERLDLFNAAPFTVQRLCELLIDPKKQYNRIDKFMRALEKNILVVSTVEPGRKLAESENGDSLDSAANGDVSLDVNVEIDMEGSDSLFNNEDSQSPNKTNVSLSNTGSDDLPESEELKASMNDIKTLDHNDDKIAIVVDNSIIESSLFQKESSRSNENSEKKALNKKNAIECKVSNVKNNESQEIEAKPVDSCRSIDSVVKETIKPACALTGLAGTYDKHVANETNDLTKGQSRATMQNLTLESEIIELSDKHKETENLLKKNNFVPLSDTIELPVEMDSVVQSEKLNKDDNLLHHEAIEGNDTVTASENIETNWKFTQEQMAVEESPSTSVVTERKVCTNIQTPPSGRQHLISDQAMDGNLENTLQHTTSSSCQEVIMRSQTHTVKVDAAGMDVDDTSQEEAMDQ